MLASAADGGSVKLSSEEAAGQNAIVSAEDLARELQKQCSLVSGAAATSQVTELIIPSFDALLTCILPSVCFTALAILIEITVYGNGKIVQKVG